MDSLTRSLRALPPGARADLLRVLTSPSEVRADVVRQFHERGKDDMVELLVMCEDDDLRRAAVVETLRRSLVKG